jgi:hypothetical protein
MMEDTKISDTGDPNIYGKKIMDVNEMNKKQQLRDKCNCSDLGTHWDYEYHRDWCEYITWVKAKIERLRRLTPAKENTK